MDQDLPEALRLAAELDACPGISYRSHAAKLRHQHAEIERMTADRDAMGRMMDALQDERDTLRAELDRWHSELSAVMRPDFKDWESVAERPTLAAWVITNQRERYAWAEGVITEVTGHEPT